MNRKNKTFIFSGGLGNQMFQYACCEELRHLGCDVEIDLSLYRRVRMHNGYELDRIFRPDPPKYTRMSPLHDLMLRLDLKFSGERTLLKDKQRFIPPAELVSHPAKRLFGYWQSEEYFADVKDRIREVFTFREVDRANRDLAEEMRGKNSVSVHIRRGDYVGNGLYDCCCTEEYYRNAIRHLQTSLDAPVFYVFSDDPAWSAKFFGSLDVRFETVDLNRGKNSFQDMFLMSQCRHNIIANSSFSWWGAYLNGNASKIVAAPKRWFNDDEFDYSHIVPKTWNKF